MYQVSRDESEGERFVINAGAWMPVRRENGHGHGRLMSDRCLRGVLRAFDREDKTRAGGFSRIFAVDDAC